MQLNKIPVEILQKITADQAWHYLIIPTDDSDDGLKIAVAEDQYSSDLQDELELVLDTTVVLEKVDKILLKEHLSKYYRKKQQQQIQEASNEEDQEYLKRLVQEAGALGSSDIHFEPYEFKARVRMRMDGKLVERFVLKKETYPSLVNKIKIKANLDIAEKRLPQDGRIFMNLEEGNIDIRVSVLPTLHGEKVVLRLLRNNSGGLDINQLGFQKEDLAAYNRGVKRPNGIVLISGPTGSGKTTTLYATLQGLNTPDTNILTIEDPIEYTMEGVNQVQLKEAIGLDFASAMRTFLRQDPDIIMVGEIRDQATAAMAIRASLTGHLVFSTIHTNSAWGIVARLIDMGIPSYLIADTLNTAVAQRLVRLLCSNCKTEHPIDGKDFPPRFPIPAAITTGYRATGCEECHFTGYDGRKAVYEVVEVDFELASHIKAQDLEVRELLKKKNVKGLAFNALELFAKGFTSLEEIYPILASA